jgi:glycosyltransferase involved in cell wall biosynthesis
VYFLTFGGWKTELQSNRWHYATRWARTAPVVLVEPTTGIRRPTVDRDPRVENVELLQVPLHPTAPDVQLQAVVTATVLRHMRASGHRRPLLWAYNPSLLGVFAAVPAVGRVYHATENYFAFDGLPDSFLQPLEAMIRVSDLVVAVSGGVERSVAERVGGARVEQVSNGCEFTFYAGGSPDAELIAAGDGFARTAVYAGNINRRLDFELLDEVSRRRPEILFAFFGPTHDLVGDDRTRWERLRGRGNVAWFGAVSHERLPHVYAAADVGLMPYKATPLLVESGFPLKALEMSAAGLPSVSTMFVALRGLAEGIVVTETFDDFSDALASTGRRSLSTTAAAELRDVACANDYDAKFRQVVNLVDGIVGAEATTKLDPVTTALGPDWTATLLLAATNPRSGVAARVKFLVMAGFGRVPRPVRMLVPRRLRKGITRLFTPYSV